MLELIVMPGLCTGWIENPIPISNYPERGEDCTNRFRLKQPFSGLQVVNLIILILVGLILIGFKKMQYYTCPG